MMLISSLLVFISSLSIIRGHQPLVVRIKHNQDLDIHKIFNTSFGENINAQILGSSSSECQPKMPDHLTEFVILLSHSKCSNDFRRPNSHYFRGFIHRSSSAAQPDNFTMNDDKTFVWAMQPDAFAKVRDLCLSSTVCNVSVSVTNEHQPLNIPVTELPQGDPKPNNASSVMFVAICFVLLMVISLAWLVFYYVQRFRYIHCKERNSRRLAELAKKAVARVPLKTLRPGDKELGQDGEQCAICIETYRPMDNLRILPCRHYFHKLCIDPWLLEQRSCPMCKLDILQAYGMRPDTICGGQASSAAMLTPHSTNAMSQPVSPHGSLPSLNTLMLTAPSTSHEQPPINPLSVIVTTGNLIQGSLPPNQSSNLPTHIRISTSSASAKNVPLLHNQQAYFYQYDPTTSAAHLITSTSAGMSSRAGGSSGAQVMASSSSSSSSSKIHLLRAISHHHHHHHHHLSQQQQQQACSSNCGSGSGKHSNQQPLAFHSIFEDGEEDDLDQLGADELMQHHDRLMFKPSRQHLSGGGHHPYRHRKHPRNQTHSGSQQDPASRHGNMAGRFWNWLKFNNNNSTSNNRGQPDNNNIENSASSNSRNNTFQSRHYEVTLPQHALYQSSEQSNSIFVSMDLPRGSGLESGSALLVPVKLGNSSNGNGASPAAGVLMDKDSFDPSKPLSVIIDGNTGNGKGVFPPDSGVRQASSSSSTGDLPPRCQIYSLMEHQNKPSSSYQHEEYLHEASEATKAQQPVGFLSVLNNMYRWLGRDESGNVPIAANNSNSLDETGPGHQHHLHHSHHQHQSTHSNSNNQSVLVSVIVENRAGSNNNNINPNE